eukprot:scaffold26718_cov207-Skeletonema_menzelii.AAC.1
MTKAEAEKHKVPETTKTEEGSARRNIARKHDHDPTKRLTHSHQNHVIFLYDTSESRKEKKQGGGGLGGKGTWNDLDDGSMDN